MKKTYVIAEIGVNHNGDINKAKKLINIAKKIGADCVKFQAYKSNEIVLKNCDLANYQKKLRFKNQFDMLKKYELSEKQLIDLNNFSKKKKIDFMLSVFDISSFEFDQKIKNKYLKIPSGEITNYPLLKLCSKTRKTIILSTGASNLKEIKNAVKIINKKNIILLHCNSAYPTPIKDMNLNNLIMFKKYFKNFKVGLSDHSRSVLIPMVATGMGAEFIEKHITLDNKSIGPDHKSSLNPKDYKNMIENIRLADKSKGSFKRKISNSEKINRKIIRKYIVAKTTIKKGSKLNKNNLTTKRTNGGVSAINWIKLIGTKAKKNYNLDDKL